MIQIIALLRSLAAEILVLFLALMVFLAGCAVGRPETLPPEVATRDRPATSPSGKFSLKVLAEDEGRNHYQSFRILDHSGEVLYESQDRFRTQDTTFFLWDDSDRVWVYSGDVGIFFWEHHDAPQIWKKTAYERGAVMGVPPFLRKVRPGEFPQ